MPLLEDAFYTLPSQKVRCTELTNEKLFSDRLQAAGRTTTRHLDIINGKRVMLLQPYGMKTYAEASELTSFSMSIPILAYGLIGVEIVAVTAFEAKSREALREPSRWIAWVMVTTYLFCAIGGALAVSWNNEHLPLLVPNPSAISQRALPSPIPQEKKPCQQYYPLIVIAAFQYGSKAAAYYFNACIVYFCISAANTALYVASRTLYGLMREEEPRNFYDLNWKERIVQSPWLLGRVSPRRRVPLWSLLASGAAFLWLIALRAAGSTSAIEVSPVWLQRERPDI